MDENLLLTRLDDELAQLPTVAAATYLLEGKRVRRRRRVISVAAVAAIGVLAVQAVAPDSGRELPVAAGGAPGAANDHVAQVDLGPDPSYVAPHPRNAVEAVDGLDGVEWYTSDEIPAWASEYGNHGPVAIAPDGRLWVAPDAEVARTVVDPFTPGEAGITSSYAVEARWDSAPEELGDGFVWVLLSDGPSPDGGTMEKPGLWTDDFELWVDDATASKQGRPSFANRLLTFADDTTNAVRAGTEGEGVLLLHQRRAPELASSWGKYERAAVAEVEWMNGRWYVMAADPKDGGPWYEAWPADTAADFDAFLALIAKRRL